MQQQIPFGNDNKKSKDKYKSVVSGFARKEKLRWRLCGFPSCGVVPMLLVLT